MIDLYEKELLTTNSIRICHKHVKGLCLYGAQCIFTHVDKKELLMITDDNPGVTPCAFLTENNGCAMIMPQRMNTTSYKFILKSCELHRGYNHFVKPKYVCERYFYSTSMNKTYDACGKGNLCPYLHIPWKNFVRNMFPSKRDPNKILCMEFLTQITFNYVYKEMLSEFNTITQMHCQAMIRYTRMYIPKCIKCHLPPYKAKLLHPKALTTYVLHKLNLFPDLISTVTEYMYADHTIKPDGSPDCIFARKLKTSYYPYIKIVELQVLSNLFIHGPRIVPLFPRYCLRLNKSGDNFTIDNTSYCGITMTKDIREYLMNILTNADK